MNARLKLNSAAVQGSFVVAGVVGWAFESWPAFLLAIAVLVGCALHDGGIRPRPKKGR